MNIQKSCWVFETTVHNVVSSIKGECISNWSVVDLMRICKYLLNGNQLLMFNIYLSSYNNRSLNIICNLLSIQIWAQLSCNRIYSLWVVLVASVTISTISCIKLLTIEIIYPINFVYCNPIHQIAVISNRVWRILTMNIFKTECIWIVSPNLTTD